MEADSYFFSAFGARFEQIPHTPINWMRYNFKDRRIVPTKYTVRTNEHNPGNSHLKSWPVETSMDGKNGREVACDKKNKQPEAKLINGTFAIGSRPRTVAFEFSMVVVDELL
jgi:hypothetical protein